MIALSTITNGVGANGVGTDWLSSFTRETIIAFLAGLLVGLFCFAVKAAWEKFIEPWRRDAVYAHLRLAGDWNYFQDETATDGEGFSDKVTWSVNLIQRAHMIRGTATSTRVQKYGEPPPPVFHYNVEGLFFLDRKNCGSPSFHRRFQSKEEKLKSPTGVSSGLRSLRAL